MCIPVIKLVYSIPLFHRAIKGDIRQATTVVERFIAKPYYHTIAGFSTPKSQNEPLFPKKERLILVHVQAEIIQLSICLPKKPATVCTSFCSPSTRGVLSSAISSMTHPIRSP